MTLKAKIEAVLFMTEKPLRAQALAGIVGEEVQTVRATLLELIHEYEERQGGLEINDEDGYSFQVKDAYANLMDEFLPIEMSAAQLRTLSAIAIKQPISQSEIIRVRGAGAYDHIKELVQRGLVAKREDEKNRSPMLTTTKAFQEYFRLTKDGKSLRQYLKRQMKKKEKEDSAESAPDSEFTSELEKVLAESQQLLADSQEMLAGGTDSLSFEPVDQSINMGAKAQINEPAPADTEEKIPVEELQAVVETSSASPQNEPSESVSVNTEMVESSTGENLL